MPASPEMAPTGEIDVGPSLAASIRDVFGTMLGCEVCPAASAADYDVHGTVAIGSSRVKGRVSVSFTRHTALRAYERMLCEQADAIDEDVLDVVAELTNMVAGAAKSRLGRDDLELGIPVVRTLPDEDDHTVDGPVRLDFGSELGAFGIRARFDVEPDCSAHWRAGTDECGR